MAYGIELVLLAATRSDVPIVPIVPIVPMLVLILELLLILQYTVHYCIPYTTVHSANTVYIYTCECAPAYTVYGIRYTVYGDRRFSFPPQRTQYSVLSPQYSGCLGRFPPLHVLVQQQRP
jgi:hypothetical protein